MSPPDRRFIWHSAEVAQSKLFSPGYFEASWSSRHSATPELLQLLNSVSCLLSPEFCLLEPQFSRFLSQKYPFRFHFCELCRLPEVGGGCFHVMELSLKFAEDRIEQVIGI